LPDSTRDLTLKYVSHAIHGNQLAIRMKDIAREVYVTLEYEADGETGILRRSAEVENRADAPFTIEQVSAATWNLPSGTDYRLRYLTGRWAGEWNVQEQPVNPGKTVLESRRGTTGAQNSFDFAYRLQKSEHFQPPYFYAGYSSEGIGGASRLLHRFEIDSLLPHAPEPKLRPVLYNSREATEFRVDLGVLHLTGEAWPSDNTDA